MKSVSPEIILSTLPVSAAIDILRNHPNRSFTIARYLWERSTPLHVAQQCCTETRYSAGENPFYVPGFRSDGGRYLLANRYHEYSAETPVPDPYPKRLFRHPVLTHPLPLMTLASLLHYTSQTLPNLHVIPFLDSALPILSSQRKRHLSPEHDSSSRELIQSLSSCSCHIDHSPLYHGYKNLRQRACQIGKRLPH